MKNIYIILLVILSLQLSAQDAHLTQFDALRVVLNPAEAGMFKNADFRASAQYRNQWGALGSKYSTSSFAYDMALNKRWGVGAYVINDDASKAYNVFTLVVGGAYQIMEDNKEHMLSVGLQAGVIYKSFNQNDLIFDSQWAGDNFDSDQASGEVFDSYHKLMPEVNLGVYYQSINKHQQIRPYGGLAFFHVTNPRESFLGTKQSRLPIRHQLNAGAIYKIDDKISVDPGVYVQLQRNIYEINAGVRGTYVINKYITGRLGAYYRVKDAFIILLGVNYKNVDFNMSYDINTSSLKAYTNGKGALEFSIVFRGTNKRFALPSFR
jgi:type IX secretion system PorP/SprF family membrane protein